MASNNPNIAAPSRQFESGTAAGHQLDLLLPDSVTQPLWRSLATNVQDTLFPEKLPPLQLTSRPVDVGMLLGDMVRLPWYRTVFTNLGNVISPEVLPPLELESRPADVGELISDSMSHMWWTSLLRNLADAVAPERLPALELTAKPVDPTLEASNLQLVRWSSVISTPKVFLPDKPGLTPSVDMVVRAIPNPLEFHRPEAEPAHMQASRIQGRLARSRWREAFLITVALSEATYLLVSVFIK
jgi:hypothetical protein